MLRKRREHDLKALEAKVALVDGEVEFGTRRRVNVVPADAASN